MDSGEQPLDLSTKKHKAGIFRCKICAFYTYIKSHFEQHMRFHTGEEPHSCKICNMSFLQVSDLIIHEQSIHAGGQPSSSQQDVQSDAQSVTLNNSIETHTGERTRRCEICGESFDSPSDLEKHMKSHNPSPENRFRGDRCSHDTNNNFSFKSDGMTNKWEIPNKGDECKKGFTKSSVLRVHKRIHTGIQKPYQCTECEKTFKQKSHMDIHMRIHTGEKPYKCPQCEKTFANNCNLTTHFRTHTGERPYNCDGCNKSFANPSNLRIHKLIHTGERPHKCSQCEKNFTRNSSLTRHLRTHRGERPYSCDKCNKSFSDDSNLNTHKRIHTGGKTHDCPECEKTFAYKSSLTRHLRTHTGERRYRCDICNKSFSRSDNLLTHKRIHNKNGPFECLDGKKSFKSTVGLTIKSNVQERQYRCDVCGKTFTSSDQLDRHECRMSDGSDP